jgi:hypothetical protein
MRRWYARITSIAGEHVSTTGKVKFFNEAKGYCQAHPTNITTAVSATAAAISAGKAAQTAAKAGN